VAPITSVLRLPLSPVHILIAAGQLSGLDVASIALCDQIRTVDKRRLRKLLGRVDGPTIAQADEAIKVSLGLHGF